MSTTYELNPCNACIAKFKKTGCNVNDISGCCYETLGAFMGSDNPLAIHDTLQGRNAIECVQNKIRAMGRDTCDLKVAPKPILNQTPHYYPNLFKKSGNKVSALNQCFSMCKNSVYPNSCAENCVTDNATVIIKNAEKKFVETYIKIRMKKQLIKKYQKKILLHFGLPLL